MDMEEYNRDLLKINHLMSSKEYMDALIELNFLLDYKLNDFVLSEVLHKKGICLFNLNEFNEALKCFESSWKIDDYFIDHKIYDKTYFEVYGEKIKYAYFIVMAKNYTIKDNNFPYLKKLLISNSNKTEYILKMTNCNVKFINKIFEKYFYKDDYQNALKFAEMALKIDNDSIDILLYKATLYNINQSINPKSNFNMDELYNLYYSVLNNDFKSEDYKKLIDKLSKPTKIIDNAFVIKGFMLSSLNEFEKAGKIFNKCLGLNRYRDIVLIGKIQSLIHQKKYLESLFYFNDLKEIGNDYYHKIARRIFSKDKCAINIIERCLIDFDKFDNILLNALNYSYNFDFDSAIEEYDKLENNHNLKSELLFGLHRYDEAVKSICEKSDVHNKFKDYCKNKENTGFFGVYKFNISHFNWEYAYIDAGNFKRIMANTLGELNYKIDIKRFIWRIIDEDLAKKSIAENFLFIAEKTERIFVFDNNFSVDFSENDSLSQKDKKKILDLLIYKHSFEEILELNNRCLNYLNSLKNGDFLYTTKDNSLTEEDVDENPIVTYNNDKLYASVMDRIDNEFLPYLCDYIGISSLSKTDKNKTVNILINTYSAEQIHEFISNARLKYNDS